MDVRLKPKIEILDDYISRLNHAVISQDMQEAAKLDSEVLSVFVDEIENLKDELSRFDTSRAICGDAVDYIRDAELLIAKLRNYKVNLTCGLYGLSQKEGNVIELKQIQKTETNVKVEIEITFEKTMEQLDKLSEDQLSGEEKDILKGKLVDIEIAQKHGQGKKKIWDKVKPVLTFLLDKGADAAIAVMPYVIEALQKAG